MRGLSLGFVSAARMRDGRMKGALAKEAFLMKLLRDVTMIPLMCVTLGKNERDCRRRYHI